MEKDRLQELFELVRENAELNVDKAAMFSLVRSKEWPEFLILIKSYQTLSMSELLDDEKGGDKLRGAIEVLDRVVDEATRLGNEHAETDNPEQKEN